MPRKDNRTLSALLKPLDQEYEEEMVRDEALRREGSREEAMAQAADDIAVRRQMQALSRAGQTIAGAELMETEARGIAAEAIEGSPELSVAAKRQAKEDLASPGKVTKNIQASIEEETKLPRKTVRETEDQDPDDRMNVKDKFFKGLAYALPEALAMLTGAAVDGSEGAADAYFVGTQAAQSVRDAAERQAQREQAISAQTPSPEYGKFVGASGEPLVLDEATGELRDLAGNLVDPREAQLASIYKQDRSLEEKRRDREALTERTDVREDRAVRSNIRRVKDTFASRNDVKQYRDVLSSLTTLKNAVTLGKKIPGNVISLLSRSLGGEKGVLTDKDVARAQVNPSIIGDIRRIYFTKMKGKLNEVDAETVKEITEKMRQVANEVIKYKAKGFAESRAKDLRGVTQEELAEDLLLESAATEVMKPEADNKKLKRYLELKKKKGL